eukprot:6720016-Prymnesium_polylepis.1
MQSAGLATCCCILAPAGVTAPRGSTPCWASATCAAGSRPHHRLWAMVQLCRPHTSRHAPSNPQSPTSIDTRHHPQSPTSIDTTRRSPLPSRPPLCCDVS